MATSVSGYKIPGYYPELPTAKATSFIEQYGTLPIHSSADMEAVLSAMVDSGQASSKDCFTGTTPVDVASIMKNSAHIAGTEGSPGTIFITPKSNEVSDAGKFTVYVVNQLGDVFTCPIRKRAEGGWLNNSPGTIYPTFKELTAHLLSTLVGVVGDCMGIQFFTPEQRKSAIAKLDSSAPGTYICFAHEPTKEFKESEESPLCKRNVIMWKTEEGINLAFFHYDSVTRQYRNAGPYRRSMAEEMGSTGGSESPTKTLEILSDSTLGGLIGKKIRERGIEPTPLILDDIT